MRVTSNLKGYQGLQYRLTAVLLELDLLLAKCLTFAVIVVKVPCQTGRMPVEQVQPVVEPQFTLLRLPVRVS